MTNSIYPSATVRFWFNEYFGTGTGPKRKNTSLYNCSIELPDWEFNAWVDLPDLDHMQNGFSHLGYLYWKNAAWQVAKDLGFQPGMEQDFVAGQLLQSTKPRVFMKGMLIANMAKRQMQLIAELPGVEDAVFVELPICPCFKRDDATRAPHLIATNCDLSPTASGNKNKDTLSGSFDIQKLREQRRAIGLNE